MAVYYDFTWPFFGTWVQGGREGEMQRKRREMCMLSASLLIRTLTSPPPHPVTSLNLNYFLRGFISKYGHAVRELGLQYVNLGDTNLQSTIASTQDGIFT